MFLVCSKGIFFSKKDLQLHSSFNIYPYNELKWQKDFTQRYIITREGPFTGLAALELRRSKFTGPQVLESGFPCSILKGWTRPRSFRGRGLKRLYNPQVLD